MKPGLGYHELRPQEALEQERVLSAITQLALKYRCPEELYGAILDLLQATFPTDAIALGLVDFGKLRPVAWRGLMLDTRMALDLALNEALKPILSGASVTSLSFSWDSELPGQSQIVIPLLTEERVLGTLHIHPLADSEPKTFFMDDGFLSLVGRRLGDVIDHVFLLNGYREEQTRLQTLIQRIPDGVLLFSARGEVIVANEALREILEIPARNLNTEPFAFRMFSQTGQRLPRSEWPFFRAVRRGVSVYAERLKLDFEGRCKYVEISVFPIPEVEGFTSFLATVKDQTERAKAENVKDEFLSIATHELRGPLTPLRGFIQMLRQQAENGEKANLKLLTKSEEQVRRLGRLVDTILDLSRLERGQIDVRERPTDVVALLRTLLDFWRVRAEDRPVLLKYESPSIIANIDAGRLDQVMTNLVENSIKYGEGQIDVAIETDTQVLVLTVRDQGPGIAREEREKVFERMYRSEKGLQNSNSLGLGLYISKQIVEGHGGTIRVLDEKTSCFEVRLPMVSH